MTQDVLKLRAMPIAPILLSGNQTKSKEYNIFLERHENFNTFELTTNM